MQRAPPGSRFAPPRYESWCRNVHSLHDITASRREPDADPLDRSGATGEEVRLRPFPRFFGPAGRGADHEAIPPRPSAAVEVLQWLETARHVRLVPGTQRILMAFPFSAVATPFVVTRRNRRWYFANCAWDAVAFHAMLNEEVRIGTQCHHCAEPIAITLANGQAMATPRGPIVHLSLPASQWWNDIVNTCANHMVFFRSRSHLDDWRELNPGPEGAVLTGGRTHCSNGS